MSDHAHLRSWSFYIADMLACSQKVLDYTQGLTQGQFVDNSLVYDATLRNLELVGEAAGRVPDSIRNQYPSVPWRLVVATRNRLIHGYLGIDNDTVWSIIQTDLPPLIEQLRLITGRLPSFAEKG